MKLSLKPILPQWRFDIDSRKLEGTIPQNVTGETGTERGRVHTVQSILLYFESDANLNISGAVSHMDGH